MSDTRPVYKEDLDDFKKHMDRQFTDIKNSNAEISRSITEIKVKDGQQEVKIENIEKRLNNFFKALTALGVSFAGVLIKLLVDHLGS